MTMIRLSAMATAVVAAVALLSPNGGSAFTTTYTSPYPTAARKTSGSIRHHGQRINPKNRLLYNYLALSSSAVPADDTRGTFVTPMGYGLSTTVQRILSESSSSSARNHPGYCKVLATDRVIDVMEEIAGGSGDNSVASPPDVALVYDDINHDILLGLFTESDYIRFSTERATTANSEQESAQFLVDDIAKYMTKTADLIGLVETDTAQIAMNKMKDQNVRHLIVSNQLDDNSKLRSDSKVLGVISMQDVMSVIQRDERMSLTSLQSKYPFLSNPVEQMQEEMKSNANQLARDPETAKLDIIKFSTAAIAAITVAGFFSQSTWLHDHADLAMIAIFVLGYLGIIFEEVFEFNKAGVALLMSTGLWVTYADYFDSAGKASTSVLEQLGEQLAEVSDICFFLLAASAIVEVVDSHQGFKVVTNKINTTSKKELFWIIGFLTFFLSAILNNLTVTIVMVSLLRKLIPNDDDRRLFGAMVVVAANAGGVWTPIGDVTTTMLWINNQLSTVSTVTDLVLPSIVCLVSSLAFLVRQVEEDDSLKNTSLPEATPLSPRGQLVFWSGIACLLCVPVFNEFTGLPPYLAMLTGLGAMWTLTDIIHMGEEEEEGLRVPAALSRLDTSGILFFLGILMSIGVLDKSGLLKELAVFLSDTLPSLDIIATAIGLFSAVIDNVPLVAATMGMYDLSEFGQDDKLWQLIALCAGTGGSILIIGSASGVALMGLEKVDFIWYAKKVSIGAAVGYFAGIATYLAQYAVLNGNLLGSILPQAAVAADAVQQSVSTIM